MGQETVKYNYGLTYPEIASIITYEFGRKMNEQ